MPEFGDSQDPRLEKIALLDRQEMTDRLEGFRGSYPILITLTPVLLDRLAGCTLPPARIVSEISDILRDYTKDTPMATITAIHTIGKSLIGVLIPDIRQARKVEDVWNLVNL